jgi:hypothetical protein
VTEGITLPEDVLRIHLRQRYAFGLLDLPVLVGAAIDAPGNHADS